MQGATSSIAKPSLLVTRYEDDMDSNLEAEDLYETGPRGTLKKVDALNLVSLTDILGEAKWLGIIRKVKLLAYFL